MNPKRLAFFLLLAAIFAQMWFASTPLPLGGPNVMLAGLTVLLSAFCVLRRAVRTEKRSAAVCALVADYRPIIPVVAVSALLAAWALAVYLFTDTLRSQWVRLVQMALGGGVLFAVYLSVDSMRRAKFMALAIVTATFVSALFGFGVLLVGDPFLSVWLHISDVDVKEMVVVFAQGRIAGLAQNTGLFAMQLAVGISLSFAALLYSPFEQGKTGGRTCNAALFVMSMTMATALVVNATRSAILGTLAGVVIVALPSLRAPLLRRRLLFIVPLQAIWLLAFFNPVFAVRDVVGLLAGDLPEIDGLAAGDLPEIDGLAAGDRLADSGDRAVIYHKIERITAGVEYAVQLRAQNDRGFGQASEIVAVTENDGSLTLSWNAPNDPDIVGYRFRLRARGETAWEPWQGFITTAGSGHRFAMSDADGKANDKEWKLLVARTARSLPDRGLEGNTRLFQIFDGASLRRIHMAATALRYSWDHPLGTGLYRPTASHVSAGLDPLNVKIVLQEWPHNQFLHTLVLYGFPGLILLVLFYVLVLRSLIHSIRSVMRGQDADLHFLATGVVGATVAYSIVTLLVPLGPFIIDWSHFFLIGLAFSLERMATAYRGNGPIGNTSPAQG